MDMVGLIVTIVSIVVGAAGIFLGRRTIANWWRSLRPQHSVAVFGAEGSGKSTLIEYLQGRPGRHERIRTLQTQKVGKVVFDLSGNDTHFFRSSEMYDVAGHQLQQWRAVTRIQNPHGIIFVVDTFHEDDEAAKFQALYDIYHEWLGEVLGSQVRLRVIVVLLNKVNRWGRTEQERTDKIAHYRDVLFKDTVDGFRNLLPNPIVQFGCSSVVDSDFYHITNRILRDFAVALEAPHDGA